MRMPRKKLSDEPGYYHLCNRIAGPTGEYPFTDVDKEKGMRIVVELSTLFLIEVIAQCWMGNHWHLVVFAPGTPPPADVVRQRYQAYLESTGRVLDEDLSAEDLDRLGHQMIDISQFMRQVNQRYTFYYNRAHGRRGTLWADRFKSTILEGTDALWTCVKYVELNAVRAGLVGDPSDYRFCTWGRYMGSGRHDYHDHFVHHMRRSLGHLADDWTAEQVYDHFRAELVRTIVTESQVPPDQAHDAIIKACRGESMPIRFLRRTRHYTDGAIIGGKGFVQEMACRFDERTRVMQKRLSHGELEGGVGLCCFKRLRLE